MLKLLASPKILDHLSITLLQSFRDLNPKEQRFLLRFDDLLFGSLCSLQMGNFHFKHLHYHGEALFFLCASKRLLARYSFWATSTSSLEWAACSIARSRSLRSSSCSRACTSGVGPLSSPSPQLNPDGDTHIQLDWDHLKNKVLETFKKNKRRNG